MEEASPAVAGGAFFVSMCRFHCFIDASPTRMAVSEIFTTRGYGPSSGEYEERDIEGRLKINQTKSIGCNPTGAVAFSLEFRCGSCWFIAKVNDEWKGEWG